MYTTKAIVAPALALLGLGASAHGAMVTPETMMHVVDAGTELRVLWLLTDTDEQVFGYTLDLDLVATDGTGAVTIDAAQTNFFEMRNVIVAGGAPLDPTFSVINPDGMGGAFISANTADLSGVVPIDGVNDVLAEVVLTIPADAQGEFMVTLGSASVLADPGGQAIDFTSAPLVLNVIVPGPGALACLAGMLSLRRRRS